MRIREYFAALWADWLVLMSGIASIALAFWAAYFPPTNIQAGRTLLWIAAVACFVLASYRIWAKAQDEKEKEVARLKAEYEQKASASQSEIDKLTTHKLTFEINTARSLVYVASYYDTQFSVMLRLYIRFENSDVTPRRVKRVSVSLIKKNEGKTETQIPLTSSELNDLVHAENHPFPKDVKWDDRNLPVDAGDWTPQHIIEGHISALGDPRKMLDKDCFLRVTLEAVSQPLTYLNFDVNWKDIPLGWMRLTPRN